MRGKIDYYHHKFDSCITDIRKTWQTINGILLSGTGKSCIVKMNVNGRVVAGPAVLYIAGNCNLYFSNMANDLDRRIPPVNADPLNYVQRLPNSFVCLPSHPDEVNSIIKLFNSKKAHLKAIPSFVYKYVSDTVSPVISALINVSFVEGRLTEDHKTVRIILVHKSGK
jgi:hypothetical protein